MACSSHVRFRVEGVTEASLNSDMFVACFFQHSGRRLAGLSPSTSSEGVSSQASRAAASNRPEGAVLRFRVGNCMSPSAIRRTSPDPDFFLTIEGGRHTQGQKADPPSST